MQVGRTIGDLCINACAPSATLPTLPDPLRVIAEYNPVSALMQSARQLFGNLPRPSGR